MKTDANGNYAYKVPAGPDRNVIIGYRHNASQVARQVRYYSHAEPTLKLAPQKLTDHHRVHLWGQVPGPNPVGRVVVLQANVPGSKRWITFRQATTGAQGSFSSGYRFFATTRTTTYRFRARGANPSGIPLGRRRKPGGEGAGQGLSYDRGYAALRGRAVPGSFGDRSELRKRARIDRREPQGRSRLRLATRPSLSPD